MTKIHGYFAHSYSYENSKIPQEKQGIAQILCLLIVTLCIMHKICLLISHILYVSFADHYFLYSIRRDCMSVQ